MKYCAFLRGINVNGINLKMADVCKVFADAGMQEASSVLATGNIIFQSEKSVQELKILLEKALSERFNYEAFLFLKSEQEIKKILNSCPFEARENFHTYIFVTENDFEEILQQEFIKSTKSDGEKAEVASGTFYCQIAKGNTLVSDFGKILGKKSFKNRLTSRNINTFDKILAKLNS